MSSKPTILCVDDEVNILEGMKINLRKVGRILTAKSGAAGLKVLEENPDVAVVVSDMRMPEMDGATFLSKARDMRPDTVRILLTGFSDMEAAVRAVNEGQLFRFLTKPCPPDMLQPTIKAAIEQHRLVTAEKELLQRTLLGSVHALIEVMALDNPEAMGRAMRIRRRVRDIGRTVSLPAIWPAEFAAIFSQLGLVALSEDVRQKLYYGRNLDETEKRSVNRSIESIVGIIGKIPRLEPAIAVLKTIAQDGKASDSIESRVVRAAMLIETCEARDLSQAEMQATLRAREDVLGSAVVAACGEPVADQDAAATVVISVAAADLAEGMVLVHDLQTENGVLLAPRGLTINASTLEHILNFTDRISADGIEVEVSTELAGENRVSASG
jgi:CheY-like chemotaxis protein